VPLLALVLLFIAVPLVELYVIIEVVGQAIGAPLTILLLALDSLIGAALLRAQGRAVWRRFTAALQEGRVPHREVLDGVLVIFGGAFLITPGFITDVVGLVLLLPPTRAMVRRVLARRLAGRVTVAVAASGPADGRARSRYDVEGTAGESRGAAADLPPPLER
jgi:UPF0716 protein FxsA